MTHDGEPAFEIEAELWRWTPESPAKASWYFVTITGAAADAIRARGFGAVRLHAAVEGVAFETSAFPHAASGGYVLPVKAAVRKAAEVSEGEMVAVRLWV